MQETSKIATIQNIYQSCPATKPPIIKKAEGTSISSKKKKNAQSVIHNPDKKVYAVRDLMMFNEQPHSEGGLNKKTVSKSNSVVIE
jgi:hypothetical protein